MGTQDQAVSIHPEVLAPKQRRVLTRLGPLIDAEGYYLGGGTAIALHLGHRRSVDLDWFTGGETPDLLALGRRIQEGGVDLEVSRVAPGTLHGEVSGVRVSLLEYRYRLLQPLVSCPEYGCQLASLDDLACMKLSALAQRGTRRDFVDIYVLALKHRPLPEMIGLYRTKYAVSETAHILYALSYFDDADHEPPPRMLWSMPWRTVKATIRGWVRELAP